MELFKRAVIVSLFFLMGVASAEEDLSIDADNIEYDKTKGVIEAFGSVEATYTNLRINTPHMIYHLAGRLISAEGGFVMLRDDQTIEGQSLNYHIDSKSGTATAVKVSFKGLYLDGKMVRLTTEEITVDDSSFTSCSALYPHYHITASNMTLYPKTNLLFTYWGWFYLGPLPTLPVPAYVYDLGPDGKKKNAAPVPEIGSNDEDGWYAIERVGWHTNSQSYGNVSMTYAEKKGLGGGVDGNYIADEDTRYFAKVGNSGKDGNWGGFSYTKHFGDELAGVSAGGPNNLINLPKGKRMRFDLNVLSRERINYERVSFLPELSLGLNTDVWNGISYDGDVKWDRILEESTTLEVYRTEFLTGLSYSFPEAALGVLTLGGDLDYKWYSDGSKWFKLIGKTDLTKGWNDFFRTSIGYRHYILMDGNSPFKFEKYRFRPSDDAYIKPIFDLDLGRLVVNVQYYVPSWDLKDVDYSLTTRYHCFDFIIMYRALRDELRFGISFVTD